MKALADNRVLSMFTPVIYGSVRVLTFYKKLLGLEEFNFSPARGKGQFTPRSINVVNCWEEVIEINPGKATKETGAALKNLNLAATVSSLPVFDKRAEQLSVDEFIHLTRLIEESRGESGN